jgi:hypothetical protein
VETLNRLGNVQISLTATLKAAIAVKDPNGVRDPIVILQVVSGRKDPIATLEIAIEAQRVAIGILQAVSGRKGPIGMRAAIAMRAVVDVALRAAIAAKDVSATLRAAIAALKGVSATLEDAIAALKGASGALARPRPDLILSRKRTT